MGPSEPLGSFKGSVSPGHPILDVVEEALGHERVLVEVHQMRRLHEVEQ